MFLSKNPMKTRSISNHMAQRQATYSQPVSTIIYSPLKQQANPLDLRSSHNNVITTYNTSNNNHISADDKEIIAYRLQNDKMSQILKEKELVIYEMRGKLQEYELYKVEKEQNTIALSNLEKKINEVLDDNKKLNNLLQDKESTLNISQNVNENISQLLEENVKLNEISKKNHVLIEKYEASVQGLKDENNRINSLYEEKIKESEIFYELIKKSEALILENEKLNFNYNMQHKELELWKQKFLQIEIMLNNLLSEKNKANPIKLKENESIINENTTLKEKILLLMDENKKLNEYFQEFRKEQEENLLKKKEEVDSLKKNKELLEKETKNAEKLKENMNVLINENNKLNKIFNEKFATPTKNSVFNNEQQMMELQDKLEIMIEENEKLNIIIEEKNNELENASKVEEFLKINEKLTKALHEKKQEAELWRKKFMETQK